MRVVFRTVGGVLVLGLTDDGLDREVAELVALLLLLHSHLLSPQILGLMM